MLRKFINEPLTDYLGKTSVILARIVISQCNPTILAVRVVVVKYSLPNKEIGLRLKV